MSVRDIKMVSGSDSDGIEMFRAKNVGPVEEYMDSASSAEDYSIDGEGLIRWAKGRRSRNDEARLRERGRGMEGKQPGWRRWTRLEKIM